jgi:hypothetical protein
VIRSRPQQAPRHAEVARRVHREDLRLLGAARHRVPAAVGVLDDDAAAVQIELDDRQMAAAVQVHGARMALGERACAADGADRPARIAGVVDVERLADLTDVDLAVRVRDERHPGITGGALQQQAATLQLEPNGAPVEIGVHRFFDRERQLGAGAQHVTGTDDWIRRIDHRRFGRRGEEGLWFADIILIERIGAGDDEQPRRIGAASGATAALPRRHDAAGITDQDRRIEPADIDAHLERARRHDAAQAAAEQRRFDLAPLFRQIPGAIGARHVA